MGGGCGGSQMNITSTILPHKTTTIQKTHTTRWFLPTGFFPDGFGAVRLHASFQEHTEKHSTRRPRGWQEDFNKMSAPRVKDGVGFLPFLGRVRPERPRRRAEPDFFVLASCLVFSLVLRILLLPAKSAFLGFRCLFGFGLLLRLQVRLAPGVLQKALSGGVVLNLRGSSLVDRSEPRRLGPKKIRPRRARCGPREGGGRAEAEIISIKCNNGHLSSKDKNATGNPSGPTESENARLSK